MVDKIQPKVQSQSTTAAKTAQNNTKTATKPNTAQITGEMQNLAGKVPDSASNEKSQIGNQLDTDKQMFKDAPPAKDGQPPKKPDGNENPPPKPPGEEGKEPPAKPDGKEGAQKAAGTGEGTNAQASGQTGNTETAQKSEGKGEDLSSKSLKELEELHSKVSGNGSGSGNGNFMTKVLDAMKDKFAAATKNNAGGTDQDSVAKAAEILGKNNKLEQG